MLRPAKAVLLAVLAAGSLATQSIAAEYAVVVNRIVYPGETVDAGSLEQVALRQNARIGNGIARDPVELEGKVARRTLLPGKLIPVSSVREAYVIEPGTVVTVIFSHGGLTITSQAVPLEPGALGAMVKLRNPDSGKVFSGVVMVDGTVRVSG